MNPEKINKAIKCLDINDVIQISSSSSLADNYFPRHVVGDEDLDIDYKHIVVKSEVLEKDDSTQDEPLLFRVFIDLGVRWVDSSQVNVGDGADSSRDESKAVDGFSIIEASYVAEYRLRSRDVEHDALDEFALNNSSYHVWPYFREFVTTQCCRMGAPRISMPMVQFAKNRDQNDSSLERFDGN